MTHWRLDPTKARTGNYWFTSDWTTMHFPTWRVWLSHLLGVPGVRMAEVGTHEGRSALWFAEHILTGPGAQIETYDTHRNPIFLSNLVAAPLQLRQRIVRCSPATSYDMTGTTRPYDAIYIDGDHTTDWVLRDAVNAWRVVKPGGRVFFDDYAGRGADFGEADGRFGVAEALEKFVKEHDAQISSVFKSAKGQICLVKRPT